MDNQDKYMISIVGEQNLDGETDKIEVMTSGKFMRKRDHFYIGYKEFSEENPAEYYDNLIKVEENIVTISRKGQMQTRLILEKGKRHQCIYQTVAGDFTIGVFTKTEPRFLCISTKHFFNFFTKICLRRPQAYEKAGNQ